MKAIEKAYFSSRSNAEFKKSLEKISWGQITIFLGELVWKYGELQIKKDKIAIIYNTIIEYKPKKIGSVSGQPSINKTLQAEVGTGCFPNLMFLYIINKMHDEAIALIEFMRSPANNFCYIEFVLDWAMRINSGSEIYRKYDAELVDFILTYLNFNIDWTLPGKDRVLEFVKVRPQLKCGKGMVYRINKTQSTPTVTWVTK